MSEDNVYNIPFNTEGLESISGFENLDLDLSGAGFNNADFNSNIDFSYDVGELNSITGIPFIDTSDLNISFTQGESLKDRVASETKKRLRRYAKKRQGGVLRYPLEALTEQTDYLQIDIEAYVPVGSGYVSAPGDRNRYVTGSFFGSDRAGRRTPDRLSKKPLINAGTILLPIPTDLQDSNSVNYGSSELNGMAAAGVEAAETVMMTSLERGEDPFGKIKEAYETGKTRVVEGVGSPEVATNALTKFLASKEI